MENFIKLSNSIKPTQSNLKLSPRQKAKVIRLVIMLRKKKEVDVQTFSGEKMTHEKYAEVYGTSAKDAAQVESFTGNYSLRTVEKSLGTHMLIVRGRIRDVERAFKTTIAGRKKGGKIYHAATVDISIPTDLKEVIVGVFGLDNYPLFERRSPRIALHDRQLMPPHNYTVPQVAAIYDFPAFTGRNQTIAILEFGGGYSDADMRSYFQGLNLPVPTINNISIDGQSNGSASTECTMDIQIAAAVAPDAAITVYFAQNTSSSYLNAINRIIADQPAILSISWAAAEDPSYPPFLDNLNNAFQTAAAHHITVCASSGDRGPDAGERDGRLHVYFPASSPYVLSCGGTKLIADNGAVTSETVWNEGDKATSGGGVSAYFQVPDYQQAAGVPPLANGFAGRGVPDVAANSDLATGYQVVIGGGHYVVGGTSAAAPLIAGLIARLNEQTGAPMGFANPHFYARPATCRDITQGNNVNSSGNGYDAGPGWDACTGLGVPFSF
jgi:kumamolisin